MTAVSIENRSLVIVSGEEAESFLQAIVTTDLSLVGSGEAWPGALLTPQGKIMFEFLIGRTADGLVLEARAEDADALIKRLMLYRLRAKAEIRKDATTSVTASWDEPAPNDALRDMRFAKAGVTLYRSASGTDGATPSLYHTLRIVNGISGGGEDGAMTDYFPHDLLMDKNGGLSFQKGCYIGQEVVSRMQHRSTARRRLATISSDSPLPEAGSAILAGEREIGTLISVEGTHGLAVIRIDKAGSALAEGATISAGGQPATPILPGWTGLEFPANTDETAS
ncbi:folate-binding protein YgfZ [Rhizobium sp. KVB221]|uniref:Folate-binding protein YgfZ n=1 Tax=Rhizobium setariae TaxID=2801340 RepID=A0A937CNG8_9HYPH|nr:folate-binding protein YgfZ [Rhizobium setariae]MBL0371168.1 folate-binding protein YgfZ [Rhizobium setariae]